MLKITENKNWPYQTVKNKEDKINQKQALDHTTILSTRNLLTRGYLTDRTLGYEASAPGPYSVYCRSYTAVQLMVKYSSRVPPGEGQTAEPDRRICSVRKAGDVVHGRPLLKVGARPNGLLWRVDLEIGI